MELRAREKREKEYINDADHYASLDRGSEHFRSIVSKALNSSGYVLFCLVFGANA